MAVKQGWDSPEAAVYGAAKWISENYVHSPASKFGPQDTLYKMRHDVQRAAPAKSRGMNMPLLRHGQPVSLA